MTTAHRPRATYRLQLHAGYTFADAERTLPYLERLGVSDLYLSPVFQAVPGSTHGYDVTDHARISDELGGQAGLERLAAAARRRNMGLVLDFVPNHMGVAGGHNRYWEDVLEHGRASRYAHFFDIDWEPLKRSLHGRVLLPVLGDHYGRVLERGELTAVLEAGRFGLRYFERTFPVSPRSVAGLLGRATQLCTGPGDPVAGRPDHESSTGESDTAELNTAELNPAELDAAELASIVAAARHLPSSNEDPDMAERQARARETGVLARRLSALLGRSPAVQRAMHTALSELNADPQALDTLIQAQNYRLSYWRTASEQINYRRFFDINDLAALRMEDPRVFAWAHTLLLDLLRRGVIRGVRLDHTDGLYDPAGYFRTLQADAAQALGWTGPDGQPWRVDDWKPGEPLPVWLVAEKILEPGEALPTSWPLHGTSGYDALASISALFVDTGSEAEFTALTASFTGDRTPYETQVRAAKRQMLSGSLASELSGLAERLERLAETDLRWRDFTLTTLRGALLETLACFPVYRTYVRAPSEAYPGGGREPGDETKIRTALQEARQEARDRELSLPGSVWDFLEAVLRLETPDPDLRERYAEFALRFQQLSGPVMAKGAEDTAFYRFVRLLALNEVGGDPARFGLTPAAFWREQLSVAAHWPARMLTLSTHDTKRGEDTRSRLGVLSELPQTWAAYLSQWSPLARAHQTRPDPAQWGHTGWPAPADILGVYQNVLGSWPGTPLPADYPERMVAAALKSAREAKRHTGWSDPNPDYEAALESFVRGLLADPEWTASLDTLLARLAPHALSASLGATLLRLTLPGVPDTYQGSEGLNLSLMDPDNRRPVNYARLNRRLGALSRRHAENAQALAADLLARHDGEGLKLLLTWVSLQARRAQTELFEQGKLAALTGEGAAAPHLLAWSRTHGKQSLVALAPHRSVALTAEAQPWATGSVWGDLRLALPRGRYRDLLTAEHVTVSQAGLSVAGVLGTLPVALLLKD